MPDLSFVTTENGDVHYGFDADGTFIQIGSVPASRIKQLQDRGAGLAELAKSDDPDAQRRHDYAANLLPYSAGSKAGSKSKASKEGGES